MTSHDTDEAPGDDHPVEPGQLQPDGAVEGEEKLSLVVRGRTYVARVRARGDEMLARAQERRSRSLLLDVGFLAVEHDGQVGGGVLAGAVAFRIFLFVVPLVFVLVAGFGLASDAANKSAHDLAADAGITGLLASTISHVDGQSFGTKLTIFLIGGFAMIIGARTLLLVVNAVHVLVWRLPRTRLRRPARAAGGLILVVLLGLLYVRGLSWLEDSVDLGRGALLVTIVTTVLLMAGMLVLWTWASLKIFPHPPGLVATDVLPGALFVAVGFAALRVFTIVYVSRSFVSKSETYGAIGGSLALLLWAYVLGRIIAGSAVVNAAYWTSRHGMIAEPLPPPPSDPTG